MYISEFAVGFICGAIVEIVVLVAIALKNSNHEE